MAAYLLAQLSVQDAAGFQRYREVVVPVIERHGGRYLVRGGATDVLEGELAHPRLVILEFPDATAARRFYDSPEYQAILPLRLASADGTAVIVEGVA
jgi:uncharacterized protein (DUF1330 family)